jgi:hypothetical protein
MPGTVQKQFSYIYNSQQFKTFFKKKRTKSFFKIWSFFFFSFDVLGFELRASHLLKAGAVSLETHLQ